MFFNVNQCRYIKIIFLLNCWYILKFNVLFCKSKLLLFYPINSLSCFLHFLLNITFVNESIFGSLANFNSYFLSNAIFTLVLKLELDSLDTKWFGLWPCVYERLGSIPGERSGEAEHGWVYVTSACFGYHLKLQVPVGLVVVCKSFKINKAWFTILYCEFVTVIDQTWRMSPFSGKSRYLHSRFLYIRNICEIFFFLT